MPMLGTRATTIIFTVKPVSRSVLRTARAHTFGRITLCCLNSPTGTEALADELRYHSKGLRKRPAVRGVHETAD